MSAFEMVRRGVATRVQGCWTPNLGPPSSHGTVAFEVRTFTAASSARRRVPEGEQSRPRIALLVAGRSIGFGDRFEDGLPVVEVRRRVVIAFEANDAGERLLAVDGRLEFLR